MQESPGSREDRWRRRTWPGSVITLLIALSLGSQSFSTFTTAAEVTNADRPLEGNWDLNPREAWEVGSIGNELLAMPAELRVMQDGRIVFRDFQQRVSHLLDRDGTVVASFARPGNEAGQVQRYLNCFIAGNEVVIGAPRALHVFTRDGEFVESFPNDLFQRFPMAFLDRRTMLSAPGELSHVAEGKARIQRIDLSSGDASIFAEIPVVAGKETGTGGPSLVVPGLTPVIAADFDPGSSRIYYGYTPDYRIYVADSAGKQLFTFRLDRERLAISPERKRAHFEKVNLPQEKLDAIVAGLPDRLASFRAVQADAGLIFVFPSTSLERKIDHQPIDIFSPDGQYIYRTDLRLGRGLRFNPGNVVFAGGELFIIQEDTEGHAAVARYEISLP